MGKIKCAKKEYFIYKEFGYFGYYYFVATISNNSVHYSIKTLDGVNEGTLTDKEYTKFINKLHSIDFLELNEENKEETIMTDITTADVCYVDSDNEIYFINTKERNSSLYNLIKICDSK